MAAQFPLRCHEDLWADHPDKMVATCFAPSGACVAADGGYRLAGTWSFASGVDYADFVLMGVRLPAAGGAPAPGFVIVPIAELVKVEDWDTMGLAATGSHAVRADDVFVPTYRSIRVADFVVSETPGRPAFETNLGRYPTFSVGAHGLSATAIGCLQGALDSFVAALADRRTGAMANMGARVADFVSVQARVGRAEAALRAAKTLLFHQLEESRLAVMEHGETLDQGARVDNRIAQGYSVQLALQGLDELWGAAGGAASATPRSSSAPGATRTRSRTTPSSTGTRFRLWADNAGSASNRRARTDRRPRVRIPLRGSAWDVLPACHPVGS
jgi:alkylation response protein AidB-like acyl-CoA dehydrogenase